MADVGKVEFAPDYKSEKRKRYPNMTAIFKGMERRDERRRLEREVIQAAKADRLAARENRGSNAADIDVLIKSRAALSTAIDALLAFESDHGGSE